jgi:glycosyltransferase involved in cell wall biosynthesis
MNDLTEFPESGRLRTLHVDLGRRWRGGQSQALLLASGLRDRGHAAELLAVVGSPLAARAGAAGLDTWLVAPGASRLRAALKLRKLLQRRCFDVIHCHDAHGLAAAWLAGAHRQAAVVASRRVAYPLSANVWGLARYRSARRIVAISRYVSDSVVACGIPPELVEIVYDGVLVPPLASDSERTEARRRWNPGPEAPLLGCVGYLLPEKGQEALIRALPLVRIRYPGCRLLLAGDGPCRSRLERLAAELGVTESAEFAGHVEDVAQVYRALDLFLFPSLAEPLGSALLAAMAHGLPPVAVACGAVPEIIEDGRNGLLVSSPDPAKIASAALRLLDDPPLAARLGVAARRTVEERFTASHMIEGTLALYRKIRS